MISFRLLTKNDPLYPQVIDLRLRILRLPLGLDFSEADLAAESGEDIFIAEDEGTVAGCLLLQHTDGTTCKLRQMAVDSGLQGRGIGAGLVAAAERYAAGLGKKRIMLHARMTAVPFYLKSGYATRGEPFTEVGIPHLLMEKTLS